MSMKRLIPFKLLPASWGLKGTAYDVAEAEYYLDGEELQRRLIEIRTEGDPRARSRQMVKLDFELGQITEYEYEKRVLEIEGNDRRASLALEHRHGKIGDYDYAAALIELDFPVGNDRDEALLELKYQHKRIGDYDYAKEKLNYTTREGTERALALVKVEHDFKKISDLEFEKQTATIKQEPWVGIIDSGYDSKQGLNGLYFELDWNEFWIEYLRLNGYGGQNEEQIVQQWFEDVTRETADPEDFVGQPFGYR